MKICTDCAYFSENRMCETPENGISPVTGEPRPMFASERRSASVSNVYPGTVKCGPDALHFRQKVESTKKPWWKLW